MFLYDLGDSTILTREEEGRLSSIFQKGLALETIEAALCDQLQRTPTAAEVADALTGNLHGLSKQQLHRVLLSSPYHGLLTTCTVSLLFQRMISLLFRRVVFSQRVIASCSCICCTVISLCKCFCKYPQACCSPVYFHTDMQSLLPPPPHPPVPVSLSACCHPSFLSVNLLCLFCCCCNGF